MIVGSKHDEDVLNHGHEHYGIDDEGQYPENVLVFVNSAVGESACIYVKWRCSYVSVNYSNALKCQAQRPLPIDLHIYEHTQERLNIIEDEWLAENTATQIKVIDMTDVRGVAMRHGNSSSLQIEGVDATQPCPW